MILSYYLLMSYLVGVKLFRWISIWQQKEYRIDRLLAFLKTKQGQTESGILVPLAWKKSQLRRPKLTLKALIVLLSTSIFLSLASFVQWWLLLVAYFVLPAIIVLATLPAWAITWLTLQKLQLQAKTKINRAKPEIIGVSGSYGKTTTKLLIGHLLQHKHAVWVSPKSHNNPLSIAQAIINGFQGQPLVVMEYAAYKKGEIKQLTDKYPVSCAVFTGLNAQHMALFGSYPNMLQAETELFDTLASGSVVFYNDSDSEVATQVKEFDQLSLIRATQAPVSKPSLNRQGQLGFHLNQRKLQTKVLGLHYWTNIQQAINVALQFGLSFEEVRNALEQFEPTAEFIRLHNSQAGGKILIDDRTSNPDGFEAAIKLADHIQAQHKLLITAGIVDLGEYEDKIHRDLAKAIKPVFDQVWHTSLIGQSAFEKVLGSKYTRISSIEQLRYHLKQQFDHKSLLVIEGKLHPDKMQLLMEW